MFSNKEESLKTTNNESKTILGSNASFNGELTFKGTLSVDGEFEGQLTTNDTLIVAEQGSIMADIEAGTVICKGRITGNIIASQRVEIHSTGKILGDVKTPALSIEIGAVYQGNSFMFDTENPPTFSMTKMSPVPKQKPVSNKD